MIANGRFEGCPSCRERLSPVQYSQGVNTKSEVACHIASLSALSWEDEVLDIAIHGGKHLPAFAILGQKAVTVTSHRGSEP
jgi:hypothetical protein